MGKVDCVMEACQESYNKGVSDGKAEVIRNLLVNSDLSVEEIARGTGVPLERVLEIKRSL